MKLLLDTDGLAEDRAAWPFGFAEAIPPELLRAQLEPAESLSEKREITEALVLQGMELYEQIELTIAGARFLARWCPVGAGADEAKGHIAPLTEQLRGLGVQLAQLRGAVAILTATETAGA